MTTLDQHGRTYRFCPACGGELATTFVKQGEPKRPVCRTCGYVVYLDPKVAVGTIVRNESDSIALVRRAIEPGYGKWVFPGGYVDRGEEPTVAAIREAREEASLEIRIDGLINLYAYPGSVPIIIVYAGTSVGGNLRAADESLDAAWFKVSDLPWNELAFRSTSDALHDHLNGILHPHAV